MEDVGNLIFYILLGIIALVGSFQGKGKKKSGKPGPVQRQPGTLTTRPPVKTTAQTARPAPSTIRQERQTPFTVREERPVPGPSPWTMPTGQIIEGRYDEPMARDFSREGNIRNDMAGAFSSEGSVASGMGEAFANEGSIEDSMAAAFASEGVSALGELATGDFFQADITDGEISDAPGYDYEALPGTDIHKEGFDLKRAVIYSAILDRKEYSR